MARGKKRSNKPANEGSTASASSGVTVEQIASMPAEQHGDRAERVRAQQQIQAGEQAAAPAPGAPAPGPAAAPGGDPSGELGRLAQAIFADSQRPDEPLTAGAPNLNTGTPPDPDAPLIARLLPVLEQRARQPDATAAWQAWTLRNRARLPAGFLESLSAPPRSEDTG